LRLLLLVVIVGCAHPPTSGPSQPEPLVATAALPDVPFRQLDLAQRAQFMEQRVLPAMKPLFQRHDAAKFADFGCVTCHGDGVAQKTFEMPNKKLPVLDLADTSKLEPRDLEFMKSVVKPTISKLLDEPDLGCLDCHTGK
jgi:hypothetical protein